jgi:hypothetical protein
MCASSAENVSVSDPDKLHAPIEGSTADEAPPPIRRIHPDSTYAQDPVARRSLDYHRRRSTDEIIESLRPGGAEPLTVKRDGRILQGNTRIKVLEERGYPVNDLPREILE